MPQVPKIGRLSWRAGDDQNNILKAHSRVDALNARRELAKKKSNEALQESIDLEDSSHGGRTPSKTSTNNCEASPASLWFPHDSVVEIQQNIEAMEAHFDTKFRSFQSELKQGLDRKLLPIHRKLDLIVSGRVRFGSDANGLRGASVGRVSPASDLVFSKLQPDWDGSQPAHFVNDVTLVECSTHESSTMITSNIGFSPDGYTLNGDVSASFQVQGQAVRSARSNRSSSNSNPALDSSGTTNEFPQRIHSALSERSKYSLTSPAVNVASRSHEGRRGMWSKRFSDLTRRIDEQGLGWWRRSYMPAFILCSVCIPLSQASKILDLPGDVRFGLEISFDCLFAVDLLFRYVVSPSCKLLFKSVWTYIDIVATAPLILRIVSFVEGNALWQETPTGWKEEFLISVAPALRLLKLLRRFEKFHLLLRAFAVALEALPVLAFTMSSFVLTFAAIIFMCEDRDNIGSLPKAMWLTIVSMTTVGYGDVVPKNSAGHVITSLLLWMSALYMAIPIGIVGNAFSLVWQDRDRLLLVQRTRDRLLQVGLMPEDILDFFYVFDENKDGLLSLQEFQTMMLRLDLGFSEDRIATLFNALDVDMSGFIDDKEFVRNLFPKSFSVIYGKPTAAMSNSHVIE